MRDRWRDKLERWRDDRATRLERWIGGQKPIGVFVGRQTALAVRPPPARLVSGLVIPAQPPARRTALLATLLIALAPVLALATETPIAGAITIAVMPFLAVASLFLRSARLVLFADHVEVQKGKRVLALPYGLFRGARLVPSDYADVILVDPRGVAGVTLREGAHTLAQGERAGLALIAFRSAGELRFPDNFGVPSTEIVALLAELGALCPAPPASQDLPTVVVRTGPRLVTAPASLLRFPPRCIVCDGDGSLPMDLRAFHPAWIVAAFLGVAGELDRDFRAPACIACAEQAELRRKRACRRRALCGALIALACSAPLYLLPLERIVATFVLPFTVVAIGGAVGWFTGYPEERLVRASTDWRGRTITVPLPNEAYADETIDYSSRPRT